MDECAREHHERIAAADAEANGFAASGSDQGEGTRADVAVEVNDKLFRVRVFGLPATAGAKRASTFRGPKAVGYGGAHVAAPMHGIVAEIKVQPGDDVVDGQVVAVIEAMKMMNEVVAHRAGKVALINVHAGETVETGAPLIAFAEEP